MSEPHERLDRAMAARGVELKKRWVQLAREAEISTAALGAIRRGEYRPSPHTARALDAALEWEAGSVEAILAGGDPTPTGHRPPPAGESEPKPEPTLSQALAQLAELKARVARLEGQPRKRNDKAG